MTKAQYKTEFKNILNTLGYCTKEMTRLNKAAKKSIKVEDIEGIQKEIFNINN